VGGIGAPQAESRVENRWDAACLSWTDALPIELPRNHWCLGGTRTRNNQLMYLRTAHRTCSPPVARLNPSRGQFDGAGSVSLDEKEVSAMPAHREGAYCLCCARHLAVFHDPESERAGISPATMPTRWRVCVGDLRTRRRAVIALFR